MAKMDAIAAKMALAVWNGYVWDAATRTESARNFCLKQAGKAFAFSYGNFENSRARGGIRRDCRPCRPKHAGRVLWVNAQTCKKSITVCSQAFFAEKRLENG